MRFAVALLVLAVLAPAAQAQDLPLPPPVSIEDPAGDLQGAVPAQAAGFVDIVQAEVRPLEDTLEFRVTVADLSTDLVSALSWEQWLDFEYRGLVFHLVILGAPTTDVPTEVRTVMWGDPRATLYRVEGDFPPPLVSLPASVDVATRTWNVSLPWQAIEAGGHSPLPGEPLRLRAVATLWDPTLLDNPHGGPPVPMSAVGTGAADAALFPEGTFITVPGAIGDLALSTPLPVRSSNGEATTLHWPVEVINRGARELEVRFDLDAGDGEGRVPPGVRLGPGANATINVYVTVPFMHQHGALREFPLTAKAGPGDQATLRLGVDYPAIAQPAGHHPDLYLHTSMQRALGAVDVSSGPLWMNTLEDDPAADGDLLQPFEANCPLRDPGLPPPVGPGPDIFDFGSYWSIPLAPALAMGLDGRLGETASLDLVLAGAAGAPPGTLYGRLTRATEAFEDGSGPFANRTDPFRAAVPVPATPGPTDLALHLDLPIPDSLDLVRPARGENLVLALLLCLDAPAPTGFPVAFAAALAGATGHAPYTIRAGAHLQMPLDEYHDVIPLPASAQGLSLRVDEAVVRAAPGATVLWRPRLEFPANGTGDYAVRLFGTGAEHATLLGPDAVRGPQPLEVPVSLVVPDGRPGDVIDLLLDVTHAQDPSRSVGLRLSVVVDPASARDDAALLASVETARKDTPAAPLGLAVVALALLALRRRA